MEEKIKEAFDVEAEEAKDLRLASGVGDSLMGRSP